MSDSLYAVRFNFMEPDFQAVYGTLIENWVSTPSIKMAALAVGALVDGSSKN